MGSRSTQAFYTDSVSQRQRKKKKERRNGKTGKTIESEMKSCFFSDQCGLKFTIHIRQRVYKLNTVLS